MSSENPGNATVNGEEQPQANAPQDAPSKPESSVPYARFKEVVDARKAAEESLTAVVDEVIATLPEDMRDLVPDLPLAEKIRWINSARKKGLFAKASEPDVDSPGSRRPGAKPPQDLSGMNPVQMMSMGYGRQ